MRVGRPGVGGSRARRRGARRRRGRGPQAERAVDVHPGAGLARARARSPASGSKAPVLTLPACAQTIVGPCSGGSASARMRPWPSTGTRTTRLRPKPEQAERLDQRRVRLLADHDRDRRRAEQPVGLDVPAAARRARRGGRRRARLKLAIVAPVTNAPPQLGGQPEQRRAASPARPLRALRRPADRPSKAGVLVPGRRQPVGGQRRRQRAADDEAEEARPGHRHRRRRAELVEQRQHVRGVARACRQRLAQRRRGAQRLRATTATARSWISAR